MPNPSLCLCKFWETPPVSGALVWIHITVPVRKNHALYTSLATVESQYYVCILSCFECTDCLSKAKLCSSFSKKKLSKIQKRENLCGWWCFIIVTVSVRTLVFSSCLKTHRGMQLKGCASVTLSTHLAEKNGALEHSVGKQRRRGIPQRHGENHGKCKLLAFFFLTLFFFFLCHNSLRYTVWGTSSYSQEMEAPGK